MIAFLTSSPFMPDENRLNPANGFVDALKASLPKRPSRGLFVASSPDAPDKNDYYGELTRLGLEASGFAFRDFRILDRRASDNAAALIASADLAILAGGHVPTQNAFFADINLKALLRGFDGTLIGISAGTMNAAETVYAQPEEPGEAISTTYRRFFPGLGLTKAMIIPHFDGSLAPRLDGLRLYADITFPDSMGRRFYILPDGSYLRVENGIETLFGEAYLIENGALRPFCNEGDHVRLPGKYIDSLHAIEDDEAFERANAMIRLLSELNTGIRAGEEQGWLSEDDVKAHIKIMRDLREDADKTQQQIADILGTSQTMYARYERGANELPIHHLIRLCEYYHVSADHFLGLDKKD